MLQDDVVVQLNRRFNAQCLMRQRVRELDREAAPLAWVCSRRGGQTATTSCEPLAEDLDDNGRGKKRVHTLSLHSWVLVV